MLRRDRCADYGVVSRGVAYAGGHCGDRLIGRFQPYAATRRWTPGVRKRWESTTDPEARIMEQADGHTYLSYGVDCTVDLETGVIVVAGAALAHVSDQSDFLVRVDEVVVVLTERSLEVQAIVADKGHHSGDNLAGLAERELVGLFSSP